MCSCQLRFNLHHVVNVEGKSTENRALYTFPRPLRSQQKMSFHAERQHVYIMFIAFIQYMNAMNMILTRLSSCGLS